MLAALLLSLVQAAPAVAGQPVGAEAAAAPRGPHSGRLFISPMGEPFRPQNRNDDGLADWFRQADLNHDGRLTLEEMQRDAGRFFALLDLNHDGEIDPDELQHYEDFIAPEIRTAERFDLGPAESGGTRGREGRSGREGGHGGRRGGGDTQSSSRAFSHSSAAGQRDGATRFGLLDLPEPVLAADADFNGGVSLAEFRTAAQQRFMALDLDHKGFLTLPDLERIRPAPPPTPEKSESDFDESSGSPSR